MNCAAFNELKDSYGNASVRITGFRETERTFIISLSLEESAMRSFNQDIKHREEEQWQITAKWVQEYKIGFRGTNQMQEYNEHPLLWSHNDIGCDLFFNGIPPNTEKLFADVYLLHSRIFGNHIPVNTFLNGKDKILDILKVGNGLFARGPKMLLVQLEEILNAYGLETTIIAGFPKRIPEGYTGTKLLMWGDNYVISERFEFERVG